MTKTTPENVPKALDAIADAVLAYKPKPRTMGAEKAQETGDETREDRREVGIAISFSKIGITSQAKTPSP
jgi:hypothetical protein